MISKTKSTIGDCEVCDKTNIEVWTMHGNILMCQSCKETEQAVITKSGEMNILIEKSKLIDNSIEVKTDLFNAGTVAAIELKAAIDQDENIPLDQKDYAYAKVCMDRFQHLQKAIFDQRTELLKQENELRVWQVQVQTTAGKLRTELREQFKSLDINYHPVVKTVKPTSPKGPKKSASVQVAEAREAAKKYGIDAWAVQMTAKAQNKSADEAAKFLAVQMGKAKA